MFISLRSDDRDISEAISQAMRMLGPLLAQSLARNMGGNASRSELDKLSEPLKKLVVCCPMAKSWLEMGLAHDSFPSSKITVAEKSTFVKKIIGYVLCLKLSLFQCHISNLWPFTASGAPSQPTR